MREGFGFSHCQIGARVFSARPLIIYIDSRRLESRRPGLQGIQVWTDRTQRSNRSKSLPMAIARASSFSSACCGWSKVTVVASAGRSWEKLKSGRYSSARRNGITSGIEHHAHQALSAFSLVRDSARTSLTASSTIRWISSGSASALRALMSCTVH